MNKFLNFFKESELGIYRVGLVLFLQLVTIILLGVFLFMPLVKVVADNEGNIRKISVKDALGLIISGEQMLIGNLNK